MDVIIGSDLIYDNIAKRSVLQIETLLVGNGIIIQFGGSLYSNKSIIKRTMENANYGQYEPDMRKTLSPKEAYGFFVLLRAELLKTIRGEYDRFAYLPSEQRALSDFKSRYSSTSMDVDCISFEDYFLVLRLIFNKCKAKPETRAGASTAMRRLFLDAIYNHGEINKVHRAFPAALAEFFLGFDDIYTANYDTNIEQFTGMNVKHLHGQFDVLEPVYDNRSFRNALSDKPAQNYQIANDYLHLYCNALMDFSKDFQFSMPTHANTALLKFASAIKNDHTLKTEVDSWKNHSNYIVRNLYEGINLKLHNPDMAFPEYYLNDLETVSGRLTILGLSPDNDTHLLSIIRSNENLSDIRYYYYDAQEKERMESYFEDKQIFCSDVRELWKSFTCNHEQHEHTVS